MAADCCTKRMDNPAEFLSAIRKGAVSFRGRVNFAEMERKYQEKYQGAECSGCLATPLDPDASAWVAESMREARRLAEPEHEAEPAAVEDEPESEAYAVARIADANELNKACKEVLAAESAVDKKCAPSQARERYEEVAKEWDRFAKRRTQIADDLFCEILSRRRTDPPPPPSSPSSSASAAASPWSPAP